MDLPTTPPEATSTTPDPNPHLSKEQQRNIKARRRELTAQLSTLLSELDHLDQLEYGPSQLDGGSG